LRLSELTEHLPHSRRGPSLDPEIVRVTHDSRAAAPGTLFAALPGLAHDGRAFLADAVARGAAAALGAAPAPSPLTIPYLEVEEPRRAAGLLAARLAGNPSSHLVMVGITGTSGKTTTSLLVDRILTLVHPRTGLFGTLVYRAAGGDAGALVAGRTTPEATDLQPLLAGLAADGGTAAVLEGSSHALVLERLAGCAFDAALFLNLTRDHLDFHRDLDDYFEAKARLFGLLKPSGKAVVNADDPWGQRLMERLPRERTVTFSLRGLEGADVTGTILPSFDAGRTRLKVSFRAPGEDYEVLSPLLGRPNAENLLAAMATALALGIPGRPAAAALSSLTSVPGRLEPVPNPFGYTLLVDYAHKPGALEGVLRTARSLVGGPGGRVIVVFGCGGDRDRGKRAEMGKLAADLADETVLTSDNPRSEDPGAILEQIRAGYEVTGRTARTVPDRREAIATALGIARAGDVVILAGKGHETYQETAGRREPFDDRLVARELVAEAMGRPAHAGRAE
jgi:UDP-N-acetylmuramoyl-L-alanyl-D-glutamate--2,6-diaminopimelate ligase